jgi:hypothetical protein
VTTANEYGGWYRSSKRSGWIRLATGPTFDETWAALLAETRMLQAGELLVTKGDANKGTGFLKPRSIERQPACRREPGSSRPLRRKF